MPTVPPPDVPPGIDPKLADYLRRLNTWAYQELSKAVKQDEAVPGILFSSSDQKNPTAIWRLTVASSGAFTGTQLPLGGGKP